MSTFGRNVLGTTGRPVQVAAEANPEWKVGGITLEWSTVAAVGADTTYPDGLVVLNGQKGLRLGQVLCRLGVAEVQTISDTPTITAGTFTITVPAMGNRPAYTTPALAYNAAIAVVQAALEAAPQIGPGGVVVSGGALPGTDVVLTFNRLLGDVPLLTIDSTGLTGGTLAVAATTAGTGSSTWGPYDPNATDGRQTLARGHTFILNESVLQSGAIAQLGGHATDHPGVLEGGKCWKQRILANYGANSLANGPTYANLEAAMPRLTYAEN